MRLELLRQLRRRRTWACLALVVGLPVVVVVAVWLSGPPAPGSQAELVDVSGRGGLDAAFFCLQVSSGFMLVVVTALVAGDAVASEAQWGSLRYLLVRPVARWRLLRVKLAVAALLAAVATLLVPLVGVVAGTLAFGWHRLVTPLGGDFGTADGTRRLALATLYVVAQYGVVLALAFLFSTATDAPLAAVGGATVLVVVSQVLDLVRALGSVRVVLPTHYWFSWFDLLRSPVPTGDMARGLVSAIPWTVVPLAIAFWHFRRKDVLS